MSTSASASSQAQDMPVAPPPNISVIFARGIIARLAIWPALRIAVEQGWGGPGGAEKRTWLASELVDAFEAIDPVPDVLYVETMLLQIMDDEFDTVLEDGSAEEVARDVVRLWEEAVAGRQGLVQELEQNVEKLKGKKVHVEEVAADNSDWEDETDEEGSEEDDDEAPMLVDSQPKPQRREPEVDEDGFTVVKGRGKSRR